VARNGQTGGPRDQESTYADEAHTATDGAVVEVGRSSLDKSRKSVDVLLKQVDILNQIAASFSSFANMPAPAPQLTDLNALIQSAVNLFAAEVDVRIVFVPCSTSVQVLVDPTSFSRAISNIIINALQARREGSTLDVKITITLKDQAAVIVIDDNGKGIPAAIREKIFQPQFTTKQSARAWDWRWRARQLPTRRHDNIRVR